MKVGIIGLGKMGANMARRLMASGHQCAGFDVNAANVEDLKNEGAEGSSTLALWKSLLLF